MLVKEYTEEFYKLNIRAGHHESDDEKVSRYMNGLRYDIQDEMSMMTIRTMEDAYQMALKAEEKLSRKQGERGPGRSQARGKLVVLTVQPLSTRTFFHLGPKSRRSLPTPLGSSQYPQVSSLSTSRFRLSGNQNSQDHEFSTHGIRSFNSPNPDGQRSTLPFLSGISLSGNRHLRCRGSRYTMKSRTPNSNMSLLR
jgi:hypothetical protein